MATNTKILTLNVQGLRDLNNRLVFIQWLNCVKPDIVCLQETHSTSIAEFKNWFTSTSYKCISSPGTARSCGVGMLISRNFEILQQWRDQNGRYVVGELSRQNYTFRIHCLYGPNANADRENFLAPYVQRLTQFYQIFSWEILIQ